MGKRKFLVKFEAETVIELDDAVIEVVDENWRSFFYDLHTPQSIAVMISKNMLRGSNLSQLDGWADQPNQNATLSEVYIEAKGVLEVGAK
jgi:hypothetical protein